VTARRGVALVVALGALGAVGALGALGAVGALGACGSEAAAPRDLDAEPAAPRADAAIVAAPVDRGFVGVITAAESVDVAPRFGGVVARVRVDVGDRVTRDQVVVEMDPAPAREEVRAAQAALAAAEAARRTANVDVDAARRKVELERASVAAGTSPARALEDAEIELKRAHTSVQRAASTVAAERARLQTARGRLAETALRAPFSGTVAMRFLDAGSTVEPGRPIVRVVGLGNLRLRFAVPPDRARGLAAEVIVEATVETIEVPVPAVIRQVPPALDPASGMLILEAELTAPPEIAGDLRPGLAARVRRSP
jgi:RND family efflux transporter MFP subunit